MYGISIANARVHLHSAQPGPEHAGELGSVPTTTFRVQVAVLGTVARWQNWGVAGASWGCTGSPAQLSGRTEVKEGPLREGRVSLAPGALPAPGRGWWPPTTWGLVEGQAFIAGGTILPTSERNRCG